MSDYSLFDFGDIGEAMVGIVNNFIDKISDALGWIVTPKNIKPYILEANKSIIEEIASREDINPIERAAIVNNYKKVVTEYKNQIDIVRIAINHLGEHTNTDDVSDDWILYFFDKMRNISDNQMKAIWGKILAGEFNEPNTYSKQLLHTLSIMDKKSALTFQKIKSSCFLRNQQILAFIYLTNKNNVRYKDIYKEVGITFSALRELDSLGLIQYRYPNYYSIQNNGNLIYYGDIEIKLTTNEKTIVTGNVSLTETGKQLCKITEPEYNNKILAKCIKTWQTLGYNPIVKIGEDNIYDIN